MKKVVKNGARPKSELRQLSEDFRRHVGALAERFDDDVKIIGEGLSGLRETTEGGFNKVEQTQGSHTHMIAQIMMDVEQIKFDLKKKVGYDDFARLEKRVARLELARNR